MKKLGDYYQDKGITLIALVVTIIVLLILAGISLGLLTGQNGLFDRVTDAKEEQRGASVQEARDLWFADVETDSLVGTHEAKTVEEIANELLEQKLITEDEKSQILENGKVTIGSREIVFEEVNTAKGDGTLSVGSGTEDDPILIQSIEDLATLSANVSLRYGGTKEGWTPNTYEGKHFKLMVNLDFQSRDSYIDPDRTDFGDVNDDGTVNNLIQEMNTGKGFKGIGYYRYGGNGSSPFCGSIDGNYKKIKNLYMQYYYFGLIGFLAGNDVTFKNLTLEDLRLGNQDLSSTNEGGLVTVSSATKVTFENCHLSGKIEMGGSGCDMGGFVGKALGSTLEFSNCDSNAITYGYNGLGGFVGNCQGGSIKLTNCTYSGNIFHRDYGGSGVGGFVGILQGNTFEATNCKCIGGIITSGYDGSCGGIIGRMEGSSLYIKDCYNTAAIDSRVRDGGIVGTVQAGIVTIQNCYNTGVIGLPNRVGVYDNGGILGEVRNCSNFLMSDCYNTGDLLGCRRYGGIVGSVNSAGGTITRCYNKGHIYHSTSNSAFNGAGGIVGQGSNAGIKIENCINFGMVDCITCQYVGGIAGDYTYSIENCYNLGEVQGKDYVGGIVGQFNGTVSKCYNTRNVMGFTYTGGIAGGITGQISNSFNLGNITKNAGPDVTTFGSIAGQASSLVDDAYLASTFSVGYGSDYNGSTDTIQKIDDVNNLYSIMQSTLTGGNWELKNGDNIPTLNIPIV